MLHTRATASRINVTRADLDEAPAQRSAWPPWRWPAAEICERRGIGHGRHYTALPDAVRQPRISALAIGGSGFSRGQHDRDLRRGQLCDGPRQQLCHRSRAEPRRAPQRALSVHYGTFTAFAITAGLLAWRPNRLPFALKAMALFLLVRAVFVALTHMAPSPIDPQSPRRSSTRSFTAATCSFPATPACRFSQHSPSGTCRSGGCSISC